MTCHCLPSNAVFERTETTRLFTDHYMLRSVFLTVSITRQVSSSVFNSHIWRIYTLCLLHWRKSRVDQCSVLTDLVPQHAQSSSSSHDEQPGNSESHSCLLCLCGHIGHCIKAQLQEWCDRTALLMNTQGKETAGIDEVNLKLMATAHLKVWTEAIKGWKNKLY